MPKLSTSTKIRRALAKNPNLNAGDLAKKLGCTPSLIGQLRKAHTNGASAPTMTKTPKAKKSKTKSLTPKTITVEGVEFTGAQLMVFAKMMSN